MTTLLLTHAACVDHEPGPFHPESPARLKAVWAALDAPPFGALVRADAPRATVEQLARAHPRRYVERVLAAVPRAGTIHLDPDTVLSPGSGEAALRAAGAVVAAVDAVYAGEAGNAFCAVRPPGHHAEPDRAMGFCLFNSVVVGAHHARAVHGAERVAIVDFDVHHGNGTQSAAEEHAWLTYASTHQWPLYPGTGAAEETGRGNVVNVPLPSGTGGAAFRRAVTQRILPALEAARPDLLIVSAGFDAHRADPLASLALDETDFAWITAELVRVARTHCAGRLVSSLEGGYDLAALGRSAAAHVSALMGG